MFLKMDYEDEAFKSTWRNGQLTIRGKKMRDNTLSILKIILDAAIAEEEFRLMWDLRDMVRPSISYWMSLLSFANANAHLLNKHTSKLVLLVSPRTKKWITPMFRTIPPSCPYLITCDWKEMKFFISD